LQPARNALDQDRFRVPRQRLQDRQRLLLRERRRALQQPVGVRDGGRGRSVCWAGGALGGCDVDPAAPGWVDCTLINGLCRRAIAVGDASGFSMLPGASLRADATILGHGIVSG
jgi:hypothetical protein